MKPWPKIWIVAGTLAGAALCWVFLPRTPVPDRVVEDLGQEVRAVIRRYELKNRTARLQRDLRFQVYGVLDHAAAGRLERETANLAFQVRNDESGNRIMTFAIARIAPYGSLLVEQTSYLSQRPGEAATQADPADAYLRAEPLIESDHPRIEKLGQTFGQAEEKARAAAIYHWVVGNIQPSAYRSRPLGALKTLQTQRGDCTEFAHLTVALARAAGLPARVVAGYRYHGGALLGNDDRHNWAEVLLAGQWRIVDAHARRFLSEEADYIAITRLRMGGEGPLAGHRRYAIDNAAIRVRQL